MTRVLLVSLDGVRPDALKLAGTPCISRLAKRGAATWSARSVMPSSTLPCHSSMFRGVEPARHGITSNTFHPIVRPVPSLIDTAYDQGRTTGAVYNWEQLRDLSDPGKLHISLMIGDSLSARGDDRVADLAIKAVDWLDLDLLFVYFGWPDECGHKFGWMSDEYLKSIQNADACLAKVLEAYAGRGWTDNTVVLVTSDHGGHERTHGTDSDEDMTIPWIISGAGIRVGVELDQAVRIYDTCPTLAAVLGLEPSKVWEGRVVREAFTLS